MVPRSLKQWPPSEPHDGETTVKEGDPLKWRLVRELGSARPWNARDGVELHYPTSVGRSDTGVTLIGDEIGLEKQVPFRFECRTVQVDTNGHVLDDTAARGLTDAYGCLSPDGRLALLRRTQWLLEIDDISGSRRTLDLARFSKKMPRCASWTDRDTLLLVFYNRSFDVDLIEVDLSGRLLWYLPHRPEPIGIIGSVQWLPQETILIADPFCHLVLEVDCRGRTVWQHGEAGHPAADVDHLSSPHGIAEGRNGWRYIADTRNHRVLVIQPDGEAFPLPLQGTTLADPTAVAPLPCGNCLIADAGHNRVIEVDTLGKVVWQTGARLEATRTLSYPRSVDLIESDRYLIADTAHDRIVVADGESVRAHPFLGSDPLFWPRCARLLPTGTLLIADARNGRIVEIRCDGHVVRELTRLADEQDAPLEDPHDVRLLPNGHILVTDSPRNVVVEIDWSGRVHRTVGDGRQGIVLDDPHSAQQLADGSLLIADTGNHRILHVSKDGAIQAEFHDFTDGPQCWRLHQPRYVEANDDGVMAVADTGNNRIVAATLEGQGLWEFSRVPESPRWHLNQPRWVRLVTGTEIVVCDHFHHRVVHVRGTPDNSGRVR